MMLQRFVGLMKQFGKQNGIPVKESDDSTLPLKVREVLAVVDVIAVVVAKNRIVTRYPSWFVGVS